MELRASKIGGCVRGYVLDLRSEEPEQLSARQRLYFAVGKTLEPVIMEHAGYDPGLLFNDTILVRVDLGGGLVLTGHPDAATDDMVIECKTMRSFAYQNMMRHGLETQFPQYLIQGSVYAKGLGKAGVKYLCLDKDASVIQEIVVPWSTLSYYWEKAVANAKKIQRWVDKKRLPGRDKELPAWYCSLAYCRHTECYYHMVRRIKPKSQSKKGTTWKMKKA